MKIQTVCAVGLAAALALTGCNKNKEEDFVSIKVFEGGYGADFFIEAGEEYGKANGIKVKTEGDPHMWDRLRPDFIAGNPPDVTWPGWGMDYWALVYEGQVEPMDEYLQQPAYGETEGKWLDTFDEELLKLGQYDGKQYLMPFHVNLNGWWYNKTMFDAKGWEPPATFEELMELGPKMIAEGVAPLTFQGQYPYYMLYAFVYPWTISSGGLQAWNDCQNLVPGAWDSPHMLRAAQAVVQMREAGFFLSGSLALDHIQSETEFLKGNAGMVPVGTWFYAEMEDAWPPGLVAEFMLPPPFADGQGDKSALMVAVEPFIIPSKAKHKKHGIEYFRYITSVDKAREFVEKKGTLMAIKGLEGVIYPSHLKKPAELYANATTKWNSEYRFWYPELADEAEAAMSALLGGEIDAQTFCDRLERKAEETRNNDQVVKHTVG